MEERAIRFMDHIRLRKSKLHVDEETIELDFGNVKELKINQQNLLDRRQESRNSLQTLNDV